MFMRSEIGGITQAAKSYKMGIGRGYVKKKFKRNLMIKKWRGKSIDQIDCSENTISQKDKGTLD